MLRFLVAKPATKPAEPAPKREPPPAAAEAPPEDSPDMVLDRIVGEEVRAGKLHYRVSWQAHGGHKPAETYVEADNDAWTDGSAGDAVAVWQASKRKAVPASKGEASVAPAPAAAPKAPAATGATPATLGEKVARIKTELALDASLPLAQAVRAAQAAVGAEPKGVLAEQVDALLHELGIDMGASAAGGGGGDQETAVAAAPPEASGKKKAKKERPAPTPEPPRKKAKKEKEEEAVPAKRLEPHAHGLHADFVRARSATLAAPAVRADAGELANHRREEAAREPRGGRGGGAELGVRRLPGRE